MDLAVPEAVPRKLIQSKSLQAMIRLSEILIKGSRP